MSRVAIRAEGIGKRYRIGRLQRYKALRDTMTDVLAAPWRRLARRQPSDSSTEEPIIWALKDVSLSIDRGEVVGVIGRNGAGKSTLLKILCRITEPTEGFAEIHGRVGSLLEVGTGFHPELTGRENVYLNGAILGMRRREIDRKFDEIIAFAEIEKFLDTPVKYYSSGMYIRLGFAVAAHLEPEVLLVDEVLAVGDAAFQRKCLGKMGEIAGEGRTVVFVSHNLSAVRHLCKSTFWVDEGRVRDRGATVSVVDRYLSTVMLGEGEYRAPVRDPIPAGQRARLLRVSVRDQRGTVAGSVLLDDPITLEVEYALAARVDNVRVGIRLIGGDGTVVFTSTDTDSPGVPAVRDAGVYVSTCRIPGQLLNAGRYYVTVGCERPMQEMLFFVEGAVSFTVTLSGGGGPTMPDDRVGLVRPVLPWTIERRVSQEGPSGVAV